MDPCVVEVDKFGFDAEADRLRRDKQVPFVEQVKLRQQQRSIRGTEQMEQKLKGTEQKQQQNVFLGKRNSKLSCNNWFNRNTKENTFVERGDWNLIIGQSGDAESVLKLSLLILGIFPILKLQKWKSLKWKMNLKGWTR
ncbi:hypothetical protein Nepgr_021826 [Nepenthes gracilis]|uniref:Uncharacterized protein n=1 Tax=Nepenthes gracilis TaxID=150966 RepID=A0AAD3SY58_NEPGR|nr:hypothetical protein Nepgr_021826 [Nepenthes gracilis]